MKRRTKKDRQRTVRAAAKRAGKPSGRSRYALKKLEQRGGNFRSSSPFVAVRAVHKETQPTEGD